MEPNLSLNVGLALGRQEERVVHGQLQNHQGSCQEPSQELGEPEEEQ